VYNYLTIDYHVAKLKIQSQGLTIVVSQTNIRMKNKDSTKCYKKSMCHTFLKNKTTTKLSFFEMMKLGNSF